MMKMEIKLDRTKLEALGYNWDLSYKILCENFERAGFIKEVHTEDGTLIYRGTDSPKDFSYFGLMYTSLIEQEWIRKTVVRLHWLNNQHTKDGSFTYSDGIETAIQYGYKGFEAYEK